MQVKARGHRITLSDGTKSRGKQLHFSAASTCRAKGCNNTLRVQVPILDAGPGAHLITINVMWNREECDHEGSAKTVTKAKIGLTEEQKLVVKEMRGAQAALGSTLTPQALWNHWPATRCPRPDEKQLITYFTNTFYRASRLSSPDNVKTFLDLGTFICTQCLIYCICWQISCTHWQISKFANGYRKFANSYILFDNAYMYAPPLTRSLLAKEFDFDDYMLTTLAEDFDQHQTLCLGSEEFVVSETESDDDDDDDDTPAAASSSSQPARKKYRRTIRGVRSVWGTPHMLSFRPAKINMDTTHNLFKANLKVTSGGFDDAAKKYHAVVEIVSTHEKAADYEYGLQKWKEKAELVGKDGIGYHPNDCPEKLPPFDPGFLLCDGAMAPRNAFAKVLPVQGYPKHEIEEARAEAMENTLMCGNHVHTVRTLYPLSNYMYPLSNYL